MVATGAVLAASATIAVYELQDGDREAGPSVARDALRAAAANVEASSTEPVPAGAASRAISAAGADPSAPGSPPPAAQMQTLRKKLAEVTREKRDLDAQIRSLEGELDRRANLPATGDPREFDLDREDWKKLAAEGRVKYRIPCMLPPEAAGTLEDLDALGMSPDEGRLLTEAQRRSNARVWDTLRPLCRDVVGNPEVVELLGPSNCLRLIEKGAMRQDMAAAAGVRRRVAEVHAGIAQPPAEGEPQQALYAALMAVTSESQRFEEDLSQSFGAEEAKRIADSMKCVATVR